MTLKIKVGNYYKTRGGRKVGPMIRRNRTDYPWECAYTTLEFTESGSYNSCGICAADLVEEWKEEPITEYKPWKDLTDLEKGALLLAHHEGKVIQSSGNGTGWAVDSRVGYSDHVYFRIKPEPVRETVEMWGTENVYTDWRVEYDTHKITFDLIDGKPDCDSIRMEEL